MNKVVLITGAAKRIGACIAKNLHQEGFNIVVHYHHSRQEADQLVTELNTSRPHSAASLQGNIVNQTDCEKIIQQTHDIWGRLDALVNNASSFYPTHLGKITEADWEDLMGSNLKGPFFLCQAAFAYLRKQSGSIINIVDIHADRPLKGYPVYCIAKAGLVMLTKTMARELAPEVRVNAIAPGLILWPEELNTLSSTVKEHVIERTCLKRKGNPQDIAESVNFLIKQNYITGQILAVDGGRNIKD